METEEFRQQAVERILTTHVGSLPRPPELLRLLRTREAGEEFSLQELNDCLDQAVNWVVTKQRDCGIDIVNDGEMSKIGYATYVNRRLTGFGGATRKGHIVQDLLDYPELARRLVKMDSVIPDTNGASCIGEVSCGDLAELEEDLARLHRCVSANQATKIFMSSASPGVISIFQLNEYYATEELYIEAVAEAMQSEYERIIKAGYILQLDCPDLAMNRHLGFAGRDQKDFIRRAAIYVEAINHATRNIAPEAMRMHLCWGNYQGPHHHDIPIGEIIDLVYRARPATLCIEAANPRHAHEWEIFQVKPLPEDKHLIPGMLDTCTNYVEHPEWIAQRLIQFSNVVGAKRISAGTDCGFSTFAGYPTVDPEIVWLKLQALADGAMLASQRLF